MLPDWPSLKRDLHALLIEGAARREHESAPLVSLVSRRKYHEGTGGVIVREDGEEDSNEMMEMSSTAVFEGEELGTIPIRDVFDRLLTTLGEIGEQKERSLLATLEAVTKETGNVIQGDRQPFSPDTLLDAYEAVQVDIGPDGLPIWPTLAISPSASEAVERAIKQLDEEPYRTRFAEITQHKQREWRDREGRRKLVD